MRLLTEVRFQVLRAASMKMAAFRVVTPCSLLEVCRRFRGADCLQAQGNHLELVPVYTAQQPRSQPSSYSLGRLCVRVCVLHASPLLCLSDRLDSCRLRSVSLCSFLCFVAVSHRCIEVQSNVHLLFEHLK
jgi:hypothetical protein